MNFNLFSDSNGGPSSPSRVPDLDGELAGVDVTGRQSFSDPIYSDSGSSQSMSFNPQAPVFQPSSSSTHGNANNNGLDAIPSTYQSYTFGAPASNPSMPQHWLHSFHESEQMVDTSDLGNHHLGREDQDFDDLEDEYLENIADDGAFPNLQAAYGFGSASANRRTPPTHPWSYLSGPSFRPHPLHSSVQRSSSSIHAGDTSNTCRDRTVRDRLRAQSRRGATTNSPQSRYLLRSVSPDDTSSSSTDTARQWRRNTRRNPRGLRLIGSPENPATERSLSQRSALNFLRRGRSRSGLAMPLSRDDLDGLDSFRYGLPGALDEDDYEIEMDGISQSSSQSAFDRLNRNVHFAIQSALKGSSSASARVSGSSGTMRPLYQRSQPLREAVSQISTDQAQRETQNEQPRKPSAVLLYQIDSSNSGSDVWPDVRDIKKIPAKYVPLAPDPYPSLTGRRDRATPRNFDIGRPKKIRALSALSSGPPPTCPVISGIGWLSNRIPAELYADIISYLSRDEIKAMRLTCKEFERHVSHAMFSTVVVPFNTEIYGMLEADSPNTLPIKVDVKGKGKARASDFGTVWKNKNRDDLYTGHGIDVYRGFGPHIQRYGMTFEVDEEALARPPHKTTTEMHSSYWGNFDWPFQEYRRFDHVADLELAADETPKMKQAFSYLKKVKELALSVDSGLGWLNGPDASARTRVLRGPAPVFGASHPIADRQTRAKQQLWETLKGLHTAYRGSCDLRQATLRQVDVEFSYSDFEDLLERHLACGSLSSDICYAQSNLVRDLQSSTGVRRVSDAFDVPVVSPKGGVDEVMAMDPFDMNTVLDVSDSRVRPGQRGAIFMVEDSVEPQLLKRHPLVPNTLTKPQKEWLLETEWAQRAFLASYMVAILDNPATFENVHTLNLSRVSSRYVSSLCRVDFWEALPSLHTVVVKVIPDWRTVEKDPAGFVETPMTTPSDAVRPFYRLLQRMLAPMDNVKTLEIGWASGGEHAEGLHARNHHLLPAPFIPPAFLNNGPNRPAIEEQLIIFPHVEHFILSNCWITPFTFTAFAKKHESASLEKLTLDSVSLSPVERANNAANANNQGLAQLFQNLQNIGQQVIVAPGPVAPPVQQPGQIVFPQNLLQHLQNLPANMPPPNFQQFFANNQNPQVQGIFNAWMNAQQAAGANPLVQPPDWRGPHRDGSWPFVLDIISPGKNFSDFNNTTSNADNDRIAKSALAEIELVSCGYARVTSPYFDNSTVDNPTPNPMTPYFQKRHEALANCVLKASDSYHGDIVQYMPQNEILAMQTVWDCRHGWEDASKAEEPTFDGALLGGTGRMSGLIRRSDRDQLEMP